MYTAIHGCKEYLKNKTKQDNRGCDMISGEAKTCQPADTIPKRGDRSCCLSVQGDATNHDGQACALNSLLTPDRPIS